MKVHGFEYLICPLDQVPLLKNNVGWQCQQGHQFDQAKQGYVNLLPVQHKKSLNPGDNKSMVSARKSFLASGYYSAVASTLSGLVLKHINTSTEREIAYLDAGCGEGYYLQEFIQHAGGEKAETSVALLGLD